ncbi:recombination protein RecR [candidate division WOR-3 bacterium]|nr:recombination protein RecR [candidate division WOR-3 bacterium]
MSQALARLIERLSELPGIGIKSAERIARHILKSSPDDIRKLTDTILEACQRVHACKRCGNLTEEELCSICSNPARLKTEICVVEEAFDIPIIERAGVFKGVYHVLGGVLSPLQDVSADKLRIGDLLDRVDREEIHEIILATSATTEGEATAHYIARQLRGKGIRVTRIARGIPVGTDLGLADEVTISKALKGREDLNSGAQD